MSNEEQYVHDYDSGHAKNIVAVHTVTTSAAFFLPYIK